VRILHIIPNLKKGGAERLVIDIVRALVVDLSIQIKLILFENKIEYQIDDLLFFIEIVPSRVQLSVLGKNIFEIDNLQKAIDNFNPDIIHTHLFQAEIISRSCIFQNAQWFSHSHDRMKSFRKFKFKALLSKKQLTDYYERKYLLSRYKKNGGTHFIAISKHTESYIKSVQTKYPVTLLHNAIDVKRFQKPADFDKSCTNSDSSPVENQPPCLPEADNDSPLTTLSSEADHHSPLTTLSAEADNYSPLTTHHSPFTIHHSPLTLNLINIGSFVPKKNQTFLLDILLELSERGVRANCLFLGDGPLKTEVQHRAKELGISNQCQFLGNVENVEEYLWQSDVYVHTATYEPLGLVLLEAMAAGLPVITLDGGGNRDLIEEGKNGFLIEEAKIKLFVEKILELKNNPSLYQNMSQYAKTYTQKFDIVPYVDNLLKLYRKVSSCVE